MTPAERLAERLVARHRQGLAPPVLREGARCLLNATGAGVAGARTPAARRLADGLQAAHGTGDAPVIGRTLQLADEAAATLTAFAVTQDDFDDAHAATIVHPAAAALAGALVATSLSAPSGRALLSAFTLGVEAQLSVAVALSPSHYELGWHSTATTAPIAAATTVALALGAGPAELAVALELATLRVVGIRQAHGTLLKGYQVGRGAADGVRAALSAHAGGMPVLPPLLGCHPGVTGTLTRESDPAPRLADQPDAGWHLLELTYKPYPAGIVCASGLEAALDLAAEVDPSRIRAVRLVVHPLVAELAGDVAPRDDMQARVSLPHGVAAALVTGRAGLEQFGPQALDDTAIARLRAVVQVLPDPDLPRTSTIVEVDTDSGTTTRRVDRARGGPDRPLTDDELAAKVQGLTEQIRPGLAEAIIDAVHGLEQDRPVADFVAVLRPGEAA